MVTVNRYQIVCGLALLVFLLGAVRAVAALLGSGGGNGAASFSIASAGQVPLALPKDRSFPAISQEVDRDPFEAPSRWQPAEAEQIGPPPFDDLLGLVTAPFLLQPDGVPRLGGTTKTAEKRADPQILARLRRAFREAKKEGEK